MGKNATAKSQDGAIEVKAVQISFGSMRKYQFDCPHCNRRLTVTPSGSDGCEHKYKLLARRFDDVVAVFEGIPAKAMIK